MKEFTMKVNQQINESAQDLVLEPALLDFKWIVKNIHLCTFDFPPAYQRYYDPWNKNKKNSYIKGIWRNASTKDLFIVVDIHSVIDNIKETDKVAAAFKADLKAQLKNGKEWLIVDGQHRIKLTGEYVLGAKWAGGDGPFVALASHCHVRLSDDTADVGKVKLNDIRPEFKQWFLSQRMMAVVVKKASLNGLKKLFIDSNDGVPVSRQDKRNAGNSNIVKHINDTANYVTVMDSIFNRVNYTGAFANKKRGHELITSIMLMFELKENTPALNDEVFLDSLFDMEHALYPMDEYRNPIGYSKTTLKRHNANMKTLAEISKHLSPKFLKLKGRLYNLYMVVSLLNNNKNRSNAIDVGLTTTYKITNPKAIAEWFSKTEKSREEFDRYATDSEGNFIKVPSTKKANFGKLIKVENMNSYRVASHNSRHRDSTNLIQIRLLGDMMSRLDNWVLMGYVQEHGKTATLADKELAMVESGFTNETGEEQSGFTMYNGDATEFDHIMPASDGGTGKDGNLRPVTKKFNRERSNKKLMVDDIKVGG